MHRVHGAIGATGRPQRGREGHERPFAGPVRRQTACMQANRHAVVNGRHAPQIAPIRSLHGATTAGRPGMNRAQKVFWAERTARKRRGSQRRRLHLHPNPTSCDSGVGPAQHTHEWPGNRLQRELTCVDWCAEIFGCSITRSRLTSRNEISQKTRLFSKTGFGERTISDSANTLSWIGLEQDRNPVKALLAMEACGASPPSPSTSLPHMVIHSGFTTDHTGSSPR